MKSSLARFGILAILMLPVPRIAHSQPTPPVSDLVRQFQQEQVFWRQFELAESIVAAHDVSVLPQIEPFLAHADRHVRGNAAFIFARLGDPRGFEIITSILIDYLTGREVHQISSVGLPWVQGQIRDDRYYAAHLLGDLRDRRAVPVLVRLLNDPDVNYIVPWSLAQIGDGAAIPPLIAILSDPDPSMRVLAIHALAELNATAALPRLRRLLNDQARSNFDKLESVADAAQAAITQLQPRLAR